MGGGVEVERGAPDEGRGEAPGEADEEEAEGPVEDRGGGGGRGVGVGHCWGGLEGRGMGKWDGEWGFVVRGSLEVCCMTKRNPPVFEPMRIGLDMGSDNSIGVTPSMCLYRCILAQK